MKVGIKHLGVETPGPWKRSGDAIYHKGTLDFGVEFTTSGFITYIACCAEGREIVTEAYNALPALFGEIEWMREENAALKADLQLMATTTPCAVCKNASKFPCGESDIRKRWQWRGAGKDVL